MRKVSIGVLLPIFLLSVTVLLSQRPGGGQESRPTAPPNTTGGPKNETISLLRDGEAVEMELEAYLVGVVLVEMPTTFEPEALRAQAVAARTYALKTCREGVRHGKNRICDDPACCQGYKDADAFPTAAVEKVRRAVQDTENLVLVYGNELIQATFFSCSGGRTEDAVAVWGNDVPYLHSVVSAGEEEGGAAFAESLIFTPEQFQNALGVGLKGAVDDWFGNVTYTAGGGVDTMVIGGVLYRGTTLRTLLGLRSTAFRVVVGNGVITIHTRGYGHRVGLSQYGANAMAKAGAGFREILKHYYSGVDIVQNSL